MREIKQETERKDRKWKDRRKRGVKRRQEKHTGRESEGGRETKKKNEQDREPERKEGGERDFSEFKLSRGLTRCLTRRSDSGRWGRRAGRARSFSPPPAARPF